MKKSLYSILIFALVALISACRQQPAANGRTPLLEVEGKFLYADELKAVIAKDATSDDSAAIAESYIRQWITNVRLYENAKRNVRNTGEIDLMVEKYRKSLIIQQYQLNMLENRLKNSLPAEEEIEKYYERHKEQLLLNEIIVRGLLLVVPKNAPKLENIRFWARKGDDASLENIEKYSLQNAISYNYYQKWTPFSEVAKVLPKTTDDPQALVTRYKFYETSDSAKCYFFNIDDYRTANQQQPYEIAKAQIVELMYFQTKSEFINNFNDELYRDAVKNKLVTFFQNQPNQ